jgi:ankyrin repeat protein
MIDGSDTHFTDGDTIECNYHNKSKWIPGKITRNRGNKTYDIAYDNRDSELRVPQERIRVSNNIRVSKFQIGTEVEGSYHNNGIWLPGKITRDRGDNTYDITYNNGNSELRVDEYSFRLNNTETRLFTAAEEGRIQAVKRIVKADNVDINWKNPNQGGKTPIHIAVENDHDDIVEFLISNGANVNARDGEESTPLMSASNVKIIWHLIENRAQVNATNKDGETPLHLASYLGKNPVVNMLIRNGANVNATDNRGNTPLHLAVYANIRVVKSLLIAGANIYIRDENNETAREIAERNGKLEIVEMIDKKDVIKLDRTTVNLLKDNQQKNNLARRIFGVQRLNEEIKGYLNNTKSKKGGRKGARKTKSVHKL